MHSGGFLLLVGLLAFWAELRLISAIPPPDICEFPKDPGSCKQTLIRYFYNKATNRCEKFIYTGCKGNGNNFVTEQECQKTCVAGNPGLCPKTAKLPIGKCSFQCLSDKACPKGQKCCQYGCWKICLYAV